MAQMKLERAGKETPTCLLLTSLSQAFCVLACPVKTCLLARAVLQTVINTALPLFLCPCSPAE